MSGGIGGVGRQEQERRKIRPAQPKEPPHPVRKWFRNPVWAGGPWRPPLGQETVEVPRSCDIAVAARGRAAWHGSPWPLALAAADVFFSPRPPVSIQPHGLPLGWSSHARPALDPGSGGPLHVWPQCLEGHSLAREGARCSRELAGPGSPLPTRRAEGVRGRCQRW